MEKFLNSISLEQDRISSELGIVGSKAEFYKDFFSKYYVNRVESIGKIPTVELIIAILASSDKTLSFEEISDAVHSCSKFIEEVDEDTHQKFMNIIILAEQNGVLDKVIKNLEKNGNFNKLSRILDDDFQYTMVLKSIADKYDIDATDLVKLVKIVANEVNLAIDLSINNPEIIDTDDDVDGFLYNRALELKFALEIFKDNYDEMLNAVGFAEDILGKTSDRSKKRLMSRMIELTGLDIGNIISELQRVNKYSDKIVLDENYRISNLKREKKVLEQLKLAIINALKYPDKIAYVPSKELSKVQNKDISRQALELIYRHNERLQGIKQTEYDELALNDATHYQVLLEKYGVLPDTYDVSLVMNTDLKSLEEMLAIIHKLQISNPKDILFIVMNSNLEKINSIYRLVERGLLNNNFIKEHLCILCNSSKEYVNLMANLEFIQEEKINPFIFISSLDRLLIDNSKFRENIIILKEYDLIKYLNTDINYAFLELDGLREAIDLLLELGYESYLEESLELLNYKDRFARLRILKELCIPISSLEELIKILSTDKFYVSDDEIDNYLYNAVDLDELSQCDCLTDLSSLTIYENSARTYNIDGVLISKPKVVRNLSKKDNIMYGLCNGSYLSDIEFSKIKRAVGNKTYNI